MKWEGRRQSENVELAEKVEHPVYGDMETLTNIASGEVTAVTPDELAFECRFEMSDHFAVAASGENVGFMSSISKLIGSLTQTPCEAKVSDFFNEYSRGKGFEIQFTSMGWQALRVMDNPQDAAAEQQMPKDGYAKLGPDAGVKNGM